MEVVGASNTQETPIGQFAPDVVAAFNKAVAEAAAKMKEATECMNLLCTASVHVEKREEQEHQIEILKYRIGTLIEKINELVELSNWQQETTCAAEKKTTELEQQMKDQQETTGAAEKRTKELEQQMKDQQETTGMVAKRIKELEQRIKDQAETIQTLTKNENNQEDQKKINAGIFKKLQSLAENQATFEKKYCQLELSMSQRDKEYAELLLEKERVAEELKQLQNEQTPADEETVQDVMNEIERVWQTPSSAGENSEHDQDEISEDEMCHPEELTGPKAPINIDLAEKTDCKESPKKPRNPQDKQQNEQELKKEPVPVPPPNVWASIQRNRQPQKAHGLSLTDNWPDSFLSTRLPLPHVPLFNMGRCKTPKMFAEPMCGCGCLEDQDLRSFMKGAASYNENRKKYIGTNKAIYCRWKRTLGNCVNANCDFNHKSQVNYAPCFFYFKNNACKHGINCDYAHDQGRSGDIPRPPKIPGLEVKLEFQNDKLVVLIRRV